jgi:hypothetical protein
MYLWSGDFGESFIPEGKAAVATMEPIYETEHGYGHSKRVEVCHKRVVVVVVVVD